MQKLLVDLKEKKYDIYIDSGLLKNIPKYINETFHYKKHFIITDDNVDKLYLKELIKSFKELELDVVTHIIPAGEKSKSLAELEKIYDKLAEDKFTRSDVIIGFGGGVVGDLSGFAAATYLRGVDFIQIPTTLLSQVDSSVGGKVAVNLRHGKNLVGNFYQPKAVYIDIDVLNTLSEREFKSGLAEVIKYACIEDANLFNKLLNYKNLDELKSEIISIIMTCLKIKVKFVIEDERDLNLRMHLNFGHTIGHGIERYFDYTKYSHGEGVSIGMSYMLLGASKLGIVDSNIVVEVNELLKKYEMPISCDVEDISKLVSYIKNDKKSKGDYISVILLDMVGKSSIYKLDVNKLEELLMEVI